MPCARRFPPPWLIKELAECFVVRDASGQAFGFFYFEDEPGWRAAAKVLMRDEGIAHRTIASLWLPR